VKYYFRFFVCLLLTGSFLATGCTPQPLAEPSAGLLPLKVLAVETFLADITQNIAGERLHVEALVPIGMDPHAFVPTPQDVAKIAESQVLIINGAGFEEWLQEVLANAGGERLVIEAAAGLTSRAPGTAEAPTLEEDAASSGHAGWRPAFLLDLLSVIHYVKTFATV
jgi:ABC-type Zn uptake system ZnuABC Zn-binding protein ZnuA